MSLKTILITGAAGAVGRFLRRELAGRYHLRLTDVVPIDDPGAEESYLRADVASAADMARAAAGCEGIVHLGAVSVEGAWEPILAANILGTYNVYEAARAAGVPRVVFASSNHAVGFYPRDRTIGTDVGVRPDSRYGVSKVFGEALASLYADKYGVASLVIRIGNVAERPADVRRLSIWLSPRDLAQLVRIGLEHPDLHYEIVYGMSDNARAWWDNANAMRLGYAPEDRSEDYAAEILAAHPAPGDGVADRMQGGDFCVVERGGDPTKPDPD